MLKPISAASLLSACLLFTACEDLETESPQVLVLRPQLSDTSKAQRLDASSAELVRYLREMGLSAEELSLETAPSSELSAAVVILLEPDQLGIPGTRLHPEDAFDPALPELDDRFVLEVHTRKGQPWVHVDANTALGTRYGIYELLRRFGARFYHPEDEWIPSLTVEQLTQRLNRPTALGAGPIFKPDFLHRSFTFHAAHPLEHLEAFSDARHPIAEAEHVTDWILKSRGDVFRGPGRGVAPESARRQREDELEHLRQARGMRRAISVQLHNRQQGERPDIDVDSPIPVETQLRELIQAQLSRYPDAYSLSVHFGPTELTTTPDRETVALLNLTGEVARALKPSLKIDINNHTTGAQPVDHYDDLGCPSGTNTRGVADYYDLSFHTESTLGVRVHTVMFHPLEGPAGVYHQPSFAHKLCLMEKASEAGRPLTYFPESAYWLSWDNAVPVYLPLYMATRQRDFALLSPLLVKEGGSLFGHRLFNSGHEWGYWQIDYAVGLWHWNSRIPMAEVLAELADPFCATLEEACPLKTTFVQGLQDLMALQWEHFLTKPDFLGRPGGLYTMFAGEDPADELGAASGLEFRPVRLPFRKALALSEAEKQRFQATDLSSLSLLEEAHQTFFETLHALREQAPVTGLRYLDEVLVGLQVNALRARHTRLLYEAVLASDEPETDESQARLREARELLGKVAQLISEQESRYRYPAAQVWGGGLTPETARPNGTTYPYRVHTKTHLMSYWHSRQDQVERLLAGEAVDPLSLQLGPVFGAAAESLTVQWPQLSQAEGELTLDSLHPGANQVLPFGQSSLQPGEGIFAVQGLIESEGTLLAPEGAIVRGTQQRTISGEDFALVEPEAPLAASVLSSLLPDFRVAWDGATGFAWAAVPQGLDTLSFEDALALTLEPREAEWLSEAFDSILPIPDPSTGEIATQIRLLGAQVRLFGSEPFAVGQELELRGELSLPDLVAALVRLAGFDEGGALILLSDLLGFDANHPPQAIAFRALLRLSP